MALLAVQILERERDALGLRRKTPPPPPLTQHDQSIARAHARGPQGAGASCPQERQGSYISDVRNSIWVYCATN